MKSKVYSFMHNTHNICLQIYLNLSQHSDIIKADVETITANLSLYNTRIARR